MKWTEPKKWTEHEHRLPMPVGLCRIETTYEGGKVVSIRALTDDEYLEEFRRWKDGDDE